MIATTKFSFTCLHVEEEKNAGIPLFYGHLDSGNVICFSPISLIQAFLPYFCSHANVGILKVCLDLYSFKKKQNLFSSDFFFFTFCFSTSNTISLFPSEQNLDRLERLRLALWVK